MVACLVLLGIGLPEAHAGLSIAAALRGDRSLHVLVGIPVYRWLATWLASNL